MNDAAVVLGRAHVARILEGDPGVAGLKEHRQHFLPELKGFDFVGLDFAFLAEFLVAQVSFFKLATVEMVQVRGLVRAEEGPGAAGLHAFHEQVGNPIRRIHVMGAAAVVTRVAAKLEEFEDIVVPRFEVGAARALALAALIDRDELIVVQLEERNNALGFAVGARDMRAGAADGSPRTAEAARPFRELGIFRDPPVHDRLQRVIHVVEIAARELGVERAGVEQRRGAAAEAAGLVEFVEPNGPIFAGALLFFKEQAHRDAHPEELGGLKALGALAGLVDDEVAIVDSLDAEKIEFEVSRWIEGGRDFA